eukprot:TRINITY_DN24106_c0_g1_i2.p1 TRINITY_DN24106_c0_g1~~TRINITY_DN24106_c0_g1_i2.p1  ORF type:complete len:309 (+),score=7.48 TRINITY_DN24106_c0_g1_i2:71-997(+)
MSCLVFLREAIPLHSTLGHKRLLQAINVNVGPRANLSLLSKTSCGDLSTQRPIPRLLCEDVYSTPMPCVCSAHRFVVRFVCELWPRRPQQDKTHPRQATATVSSLQSRSWKMEGMSASFGLPLAAVQSQSVRPQSRGITSTGTSVLDFLRPPGQMPAFSEGVFSAQRGSGWYAARELLASRKIVLATPEHACTALLTEKTSNGTDNATAPFMESPKNPYEGRAVVVSRGDCLFLQKLTYLQQVKAAIAIVVNTEKHTDLQVMSCPLQDRGSAKSVHTPSVMVSFEDGETLRWLVRTYGDVTVKVVTRT